MRSSVPEAGTNCREKKLHPTDTVGVITCTCPWYLLLAHESSNYIRECRCIYAATSTTVYIMSHRRWNSVKVNTLRPRQNGRHFPDDIFKCFFLNENVSIAIKMSLKFVPKGPINNIPALVQIMAWRRLGDKPLSEPMIVSLPTHICVTRPQWVNTNLHLIFLWMWPPSHALGWCITILAHNELKHVVHVVDFHKDIHTNYFPIQLNAIHKNDVGPKWSGRDFTSCLQIEDTSGLTHHRDLNTIVDIL